VRTFVIFFFRIHEVVGLPLPLLLPEVGHHDSLQLQLEPPVAPRVIVHLLLRTHILPHAVVFALV